MRLLIVTVVGVLADLFAALFAWIAFGFSDVPALDSLGYWQVFWITFAVTGMVGTANAMSEFRDALD